MWANSVATHTTTSDALPPPPDLIDIGATWRPHRSPEDHWRTVLLPHWQERCNEAETRFHVLAGVPRAVQANLWWVSLVRHDLTSVEEWYRVAVDKAASWRARLASGRDGRPQARDPCMEDLLTIAADVPRTFIEQQQRGALDAAALTHVLDAVVAADHDDVAAGNRPGCGYVQGMADVAAVLLLYEQAPCQAFGCLRSLSMRPLCRPILLLDMDLWSALGDVFERHLCSSLPKLAEHLTVLGLRPEFYLTEWLVPLWCRSLCPEASALTLNMLMLEGDLFLLRAALGVVSALEPGLLACDDLSDCRALCSSGPRALSISEYRACIMRVALESHLLQPLAPWFEGVGADAGRSGAPPQPHCALAGPAGKAAPSGWDEVSRDEPQLGPSPSFQKLLEVPDVLPDLISFS